MKMELIDGSEASAIINQTPGNYSKGNLLYSDIFFALTGKTKTPFCVELLLLSSGFQFLFLIFL